MRGLTTGEIVVFGAVVSLRGLSQNFGVVSEGFIEQVFFYFLV